jgi:hypothetical protein
MGIVASHFFPWLPFLALRCELPGLDSYSESSSSLSFVLLAGEGDRIFCATLPRSEVNNAIAVLSSDPL